MKPHPSGHPASWTSRFSVGEPATRDRRSAPAHLPRAQAIVTELLAEAGVTVDGPRPWDLQVRDERFYRRVLGGGSLAFGESYMDGWWECEALDELCCRLLRQRLDDKLPLRWSDLAVALSARIFNFQSRRRARRAISAHYDLGNDFFAAMLDPSLQYSCAYFSGTDDLAEAQWRKMDLICRKLGLQPGMRLLDIGCGWGGLAPHAARHYGCSVVGITLSREQQAYAAAAANEAGLPIEIRLEDYRELDERFDRIASVGMMEHVGQKNYRTYLTTAARCLDRGGLFLCHTIGGTASRVTTDPWLNRYIFPDSMLPAPAQVTRAAEGLFVLEDVHNFGSYYARTLLAWERNFAHAWPHFRAAYGDRFGRMWRYYLLSCAGAFRSRAIELYQFVFAKGGVPGGYTAVR
jgi:cyclopropane-fatty-acyl-phospholipid synthase